MAIHPDGRVFVCQQGGALRVIKNGALLATPFTTVSVNSSGERGLLGVAFDPNLRHESFRLRLLHRDDSNDSQSCQSFHSRHCERRRSCGGKRSAILDLENLSARPTTTAARYILVRTESSTLRWARTPTPPTRSRSATGWGKCCASIPTALFPRTIRQPFPDIAGSPTGNNRAIWAVGLRNPFTFSFQPGTGRMHINDVGQGAWEEVNLGVAGANYGWGAGCEGTCGVAGMTNPIYQYSSATWSDMRDRGWRFLQSHHADISRRVHWQVFPRRFLRRLDEDD